MEQQNQIQVFSEWCVLELMGHRRLAGRVSERTIGGSGFLQIDIPNPDGSFITQIYSPGSVYCLTPTEEIVCRELAKGFEPPAISRWELKRLLPSPSHEDDDFPDRESDRGLGLNDDDNDEPF